MSLPITTERVSAYLPTDHVQKLKLLAEKDGVALAHEFREAIKTYLEVVDSGNYGRGNSGNYGR